MVIESLIPQDTLNNLIVTARRTPPGPWVEVGVYQGGSALALYDACGAHTLHLFDTFTGIPFSQPENGDRHTVGEFNGNDTLAELRTRMPLAEFHVGCFPATFPDDLHDIAFVHVDCDQYRSISDCINYLWPRVISNGVMWFDDFHDLAGARKAILEHFSINALQQAPHGRRFIVKQ